jgi:hypothetical protein
MPPKGTTALRYMKLWDSEVDVFGKSPDTVKRAEYFSQTPLFVGFCDILKPYLGT